MSMVTVVVLSVLRVRHSDQGKALPYTAATAPTCRPNLLQVRGFMVNPSRVRQCLDVSLSVCMSHA